MLNYVILEREHKTSTFVYDQGAQFLIRLFRAAVV